MTTRTYRGDAPAVAKVCQISKPIGYVQGAINITINNKTVTWFEWDVEALVDAWNSASWPETRLAIASLLEPDESDSQYGTVEPSFLLTAANPGEDFFVTVTIGDGTSTNEVQQLLFDPAPTGGTFTLSFSGQTTAAITYVNGDPSATAANILSALNALSNIAPGDVTVEAVSQTEYKVTFLVTYAEINVPLITTDYSNLLGGDTSVVVTTVQDGVLPIDEVQTLSLPSVPTGGTFTLTYAGQTTANIAWNANAAAVQSALEGLSNIAPGDVVCTGGALPGTPVVITFGGSLADQDISLITGDGTLLTGTTGGNISGITTPVTGSTGVNFKYQFWRAVSGGANQTVDSTARWFTVDSSGVAHYSATFNPTTDTLATIKALLVGMTVGYYEGPNYVDYIIQSTDFTLTSSGGRLIIEPIGNYAGRGIGTSSVSAIGYIGLTVDSTTTVVSAYRTQIGTTTIERQNFTIDDPTLVGTFSINVFDNLGGSHTTDQIAYGDTETTRAAIQQAVNDALGGNYVEVINIGSGVFGLSYQNYGYQGINITILSVNEGEVSVIETTRGDPGVAERQDMLISGSEPIRGGTYTITYNGQTTSALPYGSDAAAVQSAMEALSNLDAGDLTVQGGFVNPQGIVNLTFVFSSSLGDVVPLTATSTSLINAALIVTELVTGGVGIFVEEIVRNRGPECFDDELNYTPEGVPTEDDDIVFEFGQAACRWGTKQRDEFTVHNLSTNTLVLSSGRWLFQNGQRLRVKSTGTAPAGLSAGTSYYVINSDGVGRFQLSSTLGGSAIDITDEGTGIHTIGLMLNSITKPARYSFDIGLARNNNGFVEFRPRYLTTWVDSSLLLGEREGTDSGLQRYDLGDTAVANGITILGSAAPAESDAPAVGILIQSATTDIKTYGGNVGFAPFLDEESEIRDIECYDTTLSSVGVTTCRNITMDKDCSIIGNFLPSGSIVFGK